MVNNKHGYVAKELIILCALLAVLFTVAIIKVSYAFEEINNMTQSSLASMDETLKKAALLYAKTHSDKFKEKETYIYGKELIENNYLMKLDEKDFENTKIKISRVNDKDEFTVEIMA